MINLEDGVSTIESNNIPVIHTSCFKSWIGRIVTSCPGREYTNETSLKVRLGLTIAAILSIGTLTIGAIWKDYLSNDEKFFLATVGGIGVLSSVTGFAIDGIIYNFQPS